MISRLSGLSQDIIPKLCKMLDSEAIINQRSIDAHLSQVTSAFTNQTWFMTQGVENIVEQRKGCRPGDVFVDLLFNLTIADAMTEIKEIMKQEELTTSIHWSDTRLWDSEDQSQTVDLDPIAWIDDIVIFMTPEAANCIQKMQTITCLVDHVFAKRALKANFNKGKTEWLVSPVGEGQADLAVDLFVNRQSKILVQTNADNVVTTNCPYD